MESWISPDFGDLASLLAELRTSFNDVDRFDNVARLLDSDLQNILKQEGKEAARLYALKIIYES